MEKIEKITPIVPEYELDLTSAWDSESEAEMLIEKVKSSGIYRPDLKYSGFNADDIGKKPVVVFCSSEEDLLHGSGSSGEGQNALKFALGSKRPVIAIYDGEKMVHTGNEHGGYGYKLKDPSALIAYLYLKA